jgi:thiosulfate/3-mercaptopyruvate sulfurtransferase
MSSTHADGSDFVVAPQWLQAHLEDAKVVVVDCRFALNNPQQGQTQYLTSHIPGAYYLHLQQDLSAPVQTHGGRHPLPDPHLLASKFSEMGINSDTLVVGYDDSQFAFAARLWWLLRYFGHQRVAVLDGGFAAYQRAGYAVTSVVPKPKPGTFTTMLQADQVVDIQAVQTRKTQPGSVLVDSRAQERYLGNHEPIDPVAGHIPGAINYPWLAVTNEEGYIYSQAELKAHYADLVPASEIMVYCGSGVTACVNLLGLAIAGIEGGKLYAGSWSDWCSYPLDPNMEAQIQ